MTGYRVIYRSGPDSRARDTLAEALGVALEDSIHAAERKVEVIGINCPDGTVLSIDDAKARVARFSELK
jgi:hypothetical protein